MEKFSVLLFIDFFLPKGGCSITKQIDSFVAMFVFFCFTQIKNTECSLIKRIPFWAKANYHLPTDCENDLIRRPTWSRTKSTGCWIGKKGTRGIFPKILLKLSWKIKQNGAVPSFFSFTCFLIFFVFFHFVFTFFNLSSSLHCRCSTCKKKLKPGETSWSLALPQSSL